MSRLVVRASSLIATLTLVSLVSALAWGGVTAAPLQTGSLRQVDWNAQLAQDFPPQGGDCVPPPPSLQLGPCVSVPLAQPSTVNVVGGSQPVMGFTGYADVANVLYADLDGDGLEEAVIRTDSGGTAGSLGFLVYHQTALGPQPVVAYAGYKLGVSIEGGLLVVKQPYYFGFEPNCCPTGLTVHAFALGDTGLYDVLGPRLFLLGDGGQQPVTPAELTVAAFYHALDARAYDAAYALLSPEGRARRTFDAFKAGYATTQSVSVTVAPGNTSDEVLVQITSTDAAADGTSVTRHFAGSWFVSFDASAPLGAYLARAVIQEVP